MEAELYGATHPGRNSPSGTHGGVSFIVAGAPFAKLLRVWCLLAAGTNLQVYVPLFSANAASTAWVNSGDCGVMRESKRLRILPSRPIRNLLKFQVMLPG